METNKRKQIVLWCKSLVRLTLFLIILIHFCILTAYLLPDNPIKHQYKREIGKYINPFFTQSWNLFAPNPANSNITILLQFRTINRTKVDTSSWVDIMEPLLATKKQSFWSPVQRVLKNMSSITQNISQTQRDVRQYVQKQDTITNKDLAFKKIYDQTFRTSSGHVALMQYSIYVYNKMYLGQKNDSISVRYRIVYQDFPRFSKRKLNYYDKKNSEYSEMRCNFCKLL